MGRRNKGSKIDGWLVIDKPGGMTSTMVVNRVRRSLGAAKAGHAGTLDPLATGLLPVALGEATKTVSFAMAGSKLYRFTIRWGERRATEDSEGELLERSDKRPSEAEIGAALAEFVGDIEQVPPAYSAIKLEGRRAYAMAREGEEPVLEARFVHIERMALLACPDPDHAEFEVESGKGAYMRGLVRDLARRLGTLGHIVALRRLRVGRFTLEDAISLDKLEALGHSPAALEQLLPVETALADIPALALTEIEAHLLRSGRAIQVLRTADQERIVSLAEGDMVCAMAQGRPVALTRLGRGGPVIQLHPVRVLNL
jgi:tRNA pseudouridine55 synthase